MPYWPRDEKDYRATLLVIPIRPYVNITQDECLQPLDEEDGEDTAVYELHSVDSKCILPLIV